MKDEKGVSGWVTLVFTLSLFLFVFGITTDFRNEWEKKGLFNETVLSVKNNFEMAGGLTSDVEDEIINRLSNAGIETSGVTVEGSPVSNYGEKIYYLVTLNTTIKIGSEESGKTYKKKVVGTSAYVPFS